MKRYAILLISFLLSFSVSPLAAQQYVDFTAAAERSVHAVVHIKTVFSYRTSLWEAFFGGGFWEDFFGHTPSEGYAEQRAMGFGSGVIISDDGYIVTNNHVVENAVSITVTLNDRRELPAQLVATDPATDLALIKVEQTDLPILEFANSDDVRIGEWVLAVGNPLNLTSTVTAGIVSAKARNINILEDYASIESFIQTDAAINQGNSGGALVNVEGRLIGINTAILSRTGSYSGYAFAIPSNIVRKVTHDLMRYRKVQRAYLGIVAQDIDQKVITENALPAMQGVLVKKVMIDGAAARAGLQAGDLILSCNNRPLHSFSELKEMIATAAPGDTCTFEIYRNHKKMTIILELLNNLGGSDIIYPTN